MTPPAVNAASARTHRRAVAARIAALFDLHANMVLGLCRLLLRDHHEAEDAAQQTFVSAYRSMLRGREPRDAAPWLAAIARNECRARIRKRMRAPLALEAEFAEQLPDPSDLADQTDQRAELAVLTAAIAELPARQREAVALRDFLGLSYEEVASTLSVSVPVVESLLFRARRRLRDTVRTVPRYAAGLVAIPVAIRAAVSRELPDLDSSGAAGLAGAAVATVVAGAAKVISLPFASKAATAVTVAVAATLGPQVNGLFENPPGDKGSGANTPAVLATAAPEGRGGQQSAPGKGAGGGSSEPQTENHATAPSGGDQEPSSPASSPILASEQSGEDSGQGSSGASKDKRKADEPSGEAQSSEPIRNLAETSEEELPPPPPPPAPPAESTAEPAPAEPAPAEPAPADEALPAPDAPAAPEDTASAPVPEAPADTAPAPPAP